MKHSTVYREYISKVIPLEFETIEIARQLEDKKTKLVKDRTIVYVVPNPGLFFTEKPLVSLNELYFAIFLG